MSNGKHLSHKNKKRSANQTRSKSRLALQILLSVTTAGLVGLPNTQATNITNGNSEAYTATSGSTYDIYAQKVNNDVAVNEFNSFSLDNQNTANLYFKTGAGETAEAGNLLNFVNSKIDINGTVNALSLIHI